MLRVPDLSPEAESLVSSIMGELPRALASHEVTAEQADQLLAVLEAELAAVDNAPSSAVTKRREISELAAMLLDVVSRAATDNARLPALGEPKHN